MRVAGILFLLALTAPAWGIEPGRSLNYAESRSRKIYAFVFGSKDMCRVYRRPKAPAYTLAEIRRYRFGEAYKPPEDHELIAEFRMHSRPVHIIVLDSGEALLGLDNRGVRPGMPAGDRIWRLGDDVTDERLDYGKIPEDAFSEWPDLKRELRAKAGRPEPDPRRPEDAAYGFLSRELPKGRVLVARWSEREDWRGEIAGFVVDVKKGTVALPNPRDALRMLKGPHPLWWGAGAWALGHHEHRKATAALKALPVRDAGAAIRAEVACSLVRCGDTSARRMLRGMLKNKVFAIRDAAARAVGRLPVEPGDMEALAAALDTKDDALRRLVSVSLAHIGPRALNTLQRAARSKNTATRIAVVRILAWIEDPKAEAKLLGHLKDRDPAVRHAVAVALTKPPRRVFQENGPAFAAGLGLVDRAGDKTARRRLCILAGHARLRHLDVAAALIDALRNEPAAGTALRKITKLKLETEDDWRRWLAEQKEK